MGIRNNTLSEKLQLDPRLALVSAITLVRKSEAVKLQQPLLRGKPDTPVGAVNKSRGGITRSSKNHPGASPTSHKPQLVRQAPPHDRSARDKCAKNAITKVTSELSVKANLLESMGCVHLLMMQFLRTLVRVIVKLTLQGSLHRYGS